MMRFLTLAKIELKLTLRSPDVVLFVMLMPVVIVVLIGLVFPDAGMLTETFGAFLAIGICAVGLMGLPLNLAENRHRKVLKRLQVTPASPALLLTVQMAISTVIAAVSGVLAASAAILFFGVPFPLRLGSVILGWLLVLLSIFSIGLMVASTTKDVKRAGIICSVLYFPMLLLSGTTVPYPILPEIMRKMGEFLPLRQGIILLNGLTSGASWSEFPLQLSVLTGVALIGIGVSLKTFRWDME